MSSKEGKSLSILQVAAVDITAEKLLLPLIEAQVSAGYEVDIACRAGEYANRIRARGYRLFDIPFKRTLFTIYHFYAFHKLYKLMKEQKYDVVHVHTPIAAFIGRIAARLAKIPIIIYTAHGFYFHEDMNPLIKKIFILLEKLVGRPSTDWLFTVSTEDAAAAEHNGFVKKGKILVIGNGIDVAKFQGEFPQEEIRKKLNIKDNEKTICFIGRIVKEKGIIELLEAFMKVIEKMDDVKLLIVGDTLPSDRDKKTKRILENLISDARLQGKIIYTGFREDVPELLSVSDVVVLPSYREGMPLVIMEAMASGKPVIGTDIRGCREEIVDGVTGFLVPVKDPCELYRRIMLLLLDSNNAKKMGEAGRMRATEIYDEKEVVSKQLRIYKALQIELAASKMRSVRKNKQGAC